MTPGYGAQTVPIRGFSARLCDICDRRPHWRTSGRSGRADVDVDAVAVARGEADALHFGGYLARFFELEFEPGGMNRLAVEPQVCDSAIDQVHVEHVVFAILGDRERARARCRWPVLAHAPIQYWH